MRYVVMDSNNIGKNLATEQFLMNEKDFDEPLLLFYYEENCIIVGRNQNTMEEINYDYVREHNIRVTRRMSGGGAVYQDLGNLCFSFVVPADTNEFGDFKSITKPMVDALNRITTEHVEVSGRNDILVDGKKFSGNAMYTKNGKTFSHGTLMLNVNTDIVADALNVPQDKIESKGIKSVRSRVTNLMPYLKDEYKGMTVSDFRDLLLTSIFEVKTVDDIKDKEYVVSSTDQVEINKLYEKYYNNWDWVYGNSPKFTVKRRKHFDHGTIDIRLNVEKGVISNIKFYGDFFGIKDVDELESKLKAVKYDYSSISKSLEDVDLGMFFAGIDKEEVINLLIC